MFVLYRIVSGVAGLIEQNTPFYAVKTLITRLLELDKCHNAHEREDLILSHVGKDSGLSNMLPLLNDLLMVKVCLPYISNIYVTRSEKSRLPRTQQQDTLFTIKR